MKEIKNNPKIELEDKFIYLTDKQKSKISKIARKNIIKGINTFFKNGFMDLKLCVGDKVTIYAIEIKIIDTDEIDIIDTE